MPALKKILCALDLSDQSESVAEYAVMLAKMSGASIVAVYAAPTLTGLHYLHLRLYRYAERGSHFSPGSA